MCCKTLASVELLAAANLIQAAVTPSPPLPPLPATHHPPPAPQEPVALKFEHVTSKGCTYGTPYEWSVYK
jgi:hypothetical protein